MTEYGGTECQDKPGHMGWFNCPTHSAELRARINRPLNGGSEAGSTVEHSLWESARDTIDQLRAALEAAQREIAELKACANGFAVEGLRALREVTGSANDANPWLGVTAAVVLLKDAAHRFEEEARQATFAQEHLADQLAQSRATEADLRAVLKALEPIRHGLRQGEDLATATEYMEHRDWDALETALKALDAAEQPARNG